MEIQIFLLMKTEMNFGITQRISLSEKPQGSMKGMFSSEVTTNRATNLGV